MNAHILPKRETLSQRQARWDDEAHKAWDGFNILQQLVVLLGGRWSAGRENLVPDNPDNQPTDLYFFHCSAVEKGTPHGLQKSYRTGWEQSLRCPQCERTWQRKYMSTALVAPVAP